VPQPKEVFRFNPAKPTSLLYRPGKDGELEIIGAMYSLPKGAKLSRWTTAFRSASPSGMVHANVFAGDDLHTIFADGHR
jgi:hypothetical protein